MYGERLEFSPLSVTFTVINLFSPFSHMKCIVRAFYILLLGSKLTFYCSSFLYFNIFPIEEFLYFSNQCIFHFTKATSASLFSLPSLPPSHYFPGV